MKRFFISFYVAFLLIGFVIFLGLFLKESAQAYLGGLLSSFGGLIYFIGIYTFYKVPRTSKNLWAFGLIIYLGLILVLAALYSNPVPVHYLVLFYTALHLFLWDKYLSWYSTYVNSNDTLKIGERLMDGQLSDIEGNVVDVGELRGRKSIFIFYRGNWCPFCVAQVQELVDNIDAISSSGYQVVFVGSQDVGKTALLANKFRVEAKFLVDNNLDYAKRLGILDKNGLPLGLEVLGYKPDVYRPTVLVTDENGKLTYIDLVDNYRIRPEPLDFLNMIKNIKH